jgi:hypothetical protein
MVRHVHLPFGITGRGLDEEHNAEARPHSKNMLARPDWMDITSSHAHSMSLGTHVHDAACNIRRRACWARRQQALGPAGDWAGNKRHGHGACRFADGTVFRGEWEADAWVQSLAEPRLCRLAGLGLSRALAGQPATFLIEARAAGRPARSQPLFCSWAARRRGRLFIATVRHAESSVNCSASGVHVRPWPCLFLPVPGQPETSAPARFQRQCAPCASFSGAHGLHSQVRTCRFQWYLQMHSKVSPCFCAQSMCALPLMNAQALCAAGARRGAQPPALRRRCLYGAAGGAPERCRHSRGRGRWRLYGHVLHPGRRPVHAARHQWCVPGAP